MRRAAAGNRRRIAATAVAVAGALMHATLACAQQDGRLPAQVLKPLDASNAASELAAVLRGEIEAIEGGDATSDARLALRRIAFDLLYRAGGTDAPGQAAAVAGLRLAWLRTDIDGAIGSPPQDPPRRARFDAALAAFAQGAVHGIGPAVSPDRPEEALRPLLEPLVTAVSMAAGIDPPGEEEPWPRPADRLAADTARPGTATMAVDPGPAAAFTGNDVDGLRRAIAACDSAAGSRFATTSSRWKAALRDPSLRAQAERRARWLAAELPLAVPGAFERRVRSEDPAARAACAGRATDLLTALDRARAAWAVGWADGRGDLDASMALLRTVRAIVALGAVSETQVPGDTEGCLAGWGGLALPPGGWTVGMPASTATASLAAAALLAGDTAGADSALDAVERDLVLLRLLEVAIDGRPTEAAGMKGLPSRIAGVAAAPAPGSLLGERRATLALVSRLMAEERRARAATDHELAGSLRSEASRAAGRALGDRRAPALALQAESAARAIAERRAADGVAPDR